ncbi:hypothetical protein [uncultured Sphingomonas sp.]
MIHLAPPEAFADPPSEAVIVPERSEHRVQRRLPDQPFTGD